MARITLNDDDRILDDLIRLYLRPCVWVADGTVDPAPTFTPALSAAEQTTLANLRRFARRGGLVITPDEWEAVKADAATAKAYVGLASPTTAQTTAAIKAVIRVLGAIVRN